MFHTKIGKMRGNLGYFLRGDSKFEITLKVESFAGRNFRDFASFSVVRESLYPQNRSFQVFCESLYPRNFLKLKKN